MLEDEGFKVHFLYLNNKTHWLFSALKGTRRTNSCWRINMGLYSKLTRVCVRFYRFKHCSGAVFLNGQYLQGAQKSCQSWRLFHVTHSSGVFAKELFVGNFLKVQYITLISWRRGRGGGGERG